MKTRVLIGLGVTVGVTLGVTRGATLGATLGAVALMALPTALRAGETGELLAQCAACHGPDGVARSADVPNLAGQHELYLYNQLRAFADGKRPHKEMRFMSRQLSDAEMREIAHYYEQQPR